MRVGDCVKVRDHYLTEYVKREGKILDLNRWHVLVQFDDTGECEWIYARDLEKL